MCIVSLIITVAIYVYFLKNDFKLVLRRRLWVVTGFTAVLLIGETILTKTSAGVSFLMNVIGLETCLLYTSTWKKNCSRLTSSARVSTRQEDGSIP